MESKITIPTNYLRALMAVAAKKDIRYYLNGAHIETGAFGAIGVATDGHIMLVIRLDESPRPDGVAFVPQGWKLNAIKDHSVTITNSGDAETGEYVCTLEHSGGNLRADFSQGRFPDWRRVVPREVSLQCGAFDSALIARFDAVAKILNKTSSAIVCHNGLSDPALVTFTHCENIFGVIMPVRRELATIPPAWQPVPAACEEAA